MRYISGEDLMMLRLVCFSVGTWSSARSCAVLPILTTHTPDRLGYVEGVEEIGALDYDVILKLFKNNIFVIGEKKPK